MIRLRFYHSFPTDNLQIKEKHKKASENSEALILYFCIEVPIFQIIVYVFQEHSA